MVLKMIFYYYHERAWNRLQWGKKYVKPFVLWFTGLPGSGKSTLAKEIGARLEGLNLNVEQLDGDIIRKVFPKTGFSKEERNVHICRIGFLAGLLEKKNVCVICSFISPYRESRGFVREQINHFIEIFVDAPLEVCEKRDPKGLYQQARRGEIKQFTGIDDPYEKPKKPEIIVNTANESIEGCTDRIFQYLKENRYIF